MDAKQKTAEVVRVDLAMDVLVPNTDNPNKMSTRQFNLLVDNIERTGLTDPILVRPIADNKYRIVGGHHRYDAAAYLGFDKVPCSIITDAEFDDEAEQFQMVRMNMIHGQLDPKKFMKLYQGVQEKYADELLQDMFGFADEAEFKRLIKETEKGLPLDLKEAFREAAKQIKTIDDLAKVLNDLLTNFGDTLVYGYMIFDFAGQESVWLRMRTDDKKAFLRLASIARTENVTVDGLVSKILSAIAKGDLENTVRNMAADLPKVKMPSTVLIPTEEAVEKVEKLG